MIARTTKAAALALLATAAMGLSVAQPATAQSTAADTGLGAQALPGHCAGATVRTSSQVGSTQRTTSAWGNIALDLNANTGTSDCPGVWPGGTLYVAAARCRDNARFSSWRRYNGPGRMDIATDVLPNTCFKLTWYGAGGNDGNYFQGRVIWPQ